MTDQATHFVFVIEPGFTMQAFSSAIEVLRVARKHGAQAEYRYSVAAVDNQPTAASNGIRVLPDLDLESMSRDVIVIVVSGAGADKVANPKLIAMLRRWSRQGFAIWAMSSGVVRLAQAGLIDGARVAAHWEDVPYLREMHPRVEVTTSLFMAGEKHPTCSGGGAAADLMLNYILHNGRRDLVNDIASRLMIDGIRDGRMIQALPVRLRYSTANKTVFAAIRLMEANCYEALPVNEIAHQVGVSQRQLERLFKSEFAKTPAAVYAELRLTEARQEVIQGRRPLIDIALDYGFNRATFTKAYRRVFGALPSEDRKCSAAVMS